MPKLESYVCTAIDCIKDRLAAYYHLDDEQNLIQTVLVAQQDE
ncbi:MAG: hypothetical protein U9N59_10960 [Campylobacterota bacterium]|nr:hypothetical protein [Campylobacterota bacterium]